MFLQAKALLSNATPPSTSAYSLFCHTVLRLKANVTFNYNKTFGQHACSFPVQPCFKVICLNTFTYDSSHHLLQLTAEQLQQSIWELSALAKCCIVVYTSSCHGLIFLYNIRARNCRLQRLALLAYCFSGRFSLNVCVLGLLPSIHFSP